VRTVSVPLISPPGFELLPYECHEGNVAVMSIISAERAEDAAVEADAKKGVQRSRRMRNGGNARPSRDRNGDGRFRGFTTGC
jgi:hypothetical protein